MTETGEKAAKQLREITECPICMSAFTDPRMLPCIHTFCFECLKRTAERAELKTGDKMPCPLCRKEFSIPADGMSGVQKNFFMENLLQYKTALRMESGAFICDICNASDEGKTGEIPEATMRCLECQVHYCDACSKVHRFQKLSRNHQLVQIGSDTKSEIKRSFTTKSCTKHTQKPLDYYCTDCKKIVCVSCFVESHKLHDCKDVATVDEGFRETIENNARKMSTYAEELLSMRKNTEERKEAFLKDMVVRENSVLKTNQELKEIINEHTERLLDELSVIKTQHLKEMEIELEEIDRSCTILNSFEAYCTELKSKGSPSDICSSVDELLGRADDLEKDHEAFIGRPMKSIEVTFEATDLTNVLQNANSNFVGNVQETGTQLETCAIIVGFNDRTTITDDVLKINLHRPNEISTQEQIPTTTAVEAVAAVYCNTMYVAGIGDNFDEVWKYSTVSGWIKCASLVQGRRRHSAAFIDEVLYICGGFVDSTGSVLDSVEAYDAVSDKCTFMATLIHGVHNSGNCVPLKGLLYVFGGLDKDSKEMDYVQVYNTKENTCSILPKPMPCPYSMMRAALSETSITLLGWDTCFIFNFETEIWNERNQFKTDVDHFGLVLENGRIFVIGGGICETDKDGKAVWKCRDDIRSVPLQNIIDDKPVEWEVHGKLTNPRLVHACAKVRFPV